MIAWIASILVAVAVGVAVGMRVVGWLLSPVSLEIKRLEREIAADQLEAAALQEKNAAALRVIAENTRQASRNT